MTPLAYAAEYIPEDEPLLAARAYAADLGGTPITVNQLLPGGATRTGMVPAEHAAGLPNLLEPEIMGSAIVWLASAEASQVSDERIVAAEFKQWLEGWRAAWPCGGCLL